MLTFGFRMIAKPEDVQYMKFDSQGNLYLYEPGSGISGVPHKVIEFGSDEIVYDLNENNTKEQDKKVKVESVNRLVPKRGASALR